MLEIFYLMIIFNVFMAIFGGLTMSNGNKVQTHGPGSSTGGVPGDLQGGIGGLTGFVTIMGAMVALVGSLYVVTSFTGNAKTPLSAVYGFAIVFQVAYIGAWGTFWNPLVSNLPKSLDATVLVFYGLFTFLIETIFFIGFIQMSTGGWGLYK